MRAGEPINIDIPLTGAPAPKIEWIKNKLQVPESSRLYVSLFVYHSHINLINNFCFRLKLTVNTRDCALKHPTEVMLVFTR